MQQLQSTCLLIRECRQVLLGQNDQPLSIVLLEAVAKARYSLTMCAQWFYRLHVEQNVERELTQGVRKFCDAAACLCEQDKLKWPR